MQYGTHGTARRFDDAVRREYACSSGGTTHGLADTPEQSSRRRPYHDIVRILATAGKPSAQHPTTDTERLTATDYVGVHLSLCSLLVSTGVACGRALCNVHPNQSGCQHTTRDVVYHDVSRHSLSARALCGITSSSVRNQGSLGC